MDLLKLHSVTHKLLDRMDRVEKVQHNIPLLSQYNRAGPKSQQLTFMRNKY